MDTQIPLFEDGEDAGAANGDLWEQLPVEARKQLQTLFAALLLKALESCQEGKNTNE